MSKKGPILNFLVKNNFAKSVETANAILIMVAVLNLSVSLLVLNSVFPIFTNNKPAYREGLPPEIRDTLPPEILNQIPLDKRR